MGRLLVTFLLCHEGVLRQPLLYLSLYFKQHRQQYYDLLDRVRRDGDWEAWLAFFLDGVAHTADAAVATAQRLTDLFRADRDRIQGAGKKAGSALRVHRALQERPIASLPDVAQRTGLSYPAAASGMSVLEDLGIAHEITGRQRDRLFVYEAYLSILNEGTELP